MKKTLLVALTVLSVATMAHAQGVPGAGISVTPPPCQGAGCGRFGSLNGVQTWVTDILRWISWAFWTLVILMILFTAYKYLTAGGDEEKVKSAHQNLIYTLVAIAVALLATVLPSFVQSVLQA